MIDRWIRELIDMIDRKRQRLRNIQHTLSCHHQANALTAFWCGIRDASNPVSPSLLRMICFSCILNRMLL